MAGIIITKDFWTQPSAPLWKSLSNNIDFLNSALGLCSEISDTGEKHTLTVAYVPSYFSKYSLDSDDNGHRTDDNNGSSSDESDDNVLS